MLGENPAQSLAYREAPIVSAFAQCATGICDMCAHDKKRPDNGMYVRKLTRIDGTEAIVSTLSLKCNGRHQHSPVEGSIHVEGKSVRVSERAGGYTKTFAYRILKGAETFLEKQKTQGIFISETDPVESGEEQDESMDVQPPTPRLAEEAVEDGEPFKKLKKGRP